MSPLSFSPYGPKAVLIDFEAALSIANSATKEHLLVLSRQLKAMPWADDVVLAYSQLLVSFRASISLAEVKIFVTQQWRVTASQSIASNEFKAATIEVLVNYTGPDVEEVARLKCMSTEQIIQLHTGMEYEAMAVGFQPGFAYLGTLPEELWLPRRSTPRPSVAAGSVAIATDQTAIYPHVSPGGWHLLGCVVGLPSSLEVRTGGGFEVGQRVKFQAVGAL